MNYPLKNIVSDKLYYIIVAGLLIFSFMLIYISMYWGVGLTPDSLVYIRMAEGLASGTVSKTSQHFPPLYSFMLYLTSFLNNDTLISARWFGIIIYILTIITLAVMLKKNTESGSGWALVGLFAIFTAPHLFYIYMMAWSEPLFLLLMLAGFYFLATSIHSQKKSAFVLSALFLGMAFSTRYVGISAIATATFGLLFFQKKNWTGRLKNAVVYNLLSLAPILIWIIWGRLASNSDTPRVFSYHPINLEKITSGIDEILGWFYLSSPTSWILIGIFSICYLYLAVLARAESSEKFTISEILKKLSFLFIPLYLVLLFTSISFFDAYTPLDSRILVPVYFFLMIGLVLGLSSTIINHGLSKVANTFAFIIVMALIIIQIINLQSSVTYFSKNGVGFLSRQWVQSETLAYLRSKQSERGTIYTNSPEIIEIHLKRKSRFLPARESATSKIAYDNYQNSLRQLQQEFIENDAILVYFYAFSFRKYLPTLSELNNNIKLNLLYKGSDGLVFEARE